MEELFKNVNLLYIIHDNSILMRKFMHQDSEVIDVFAFKENDSVDIGIKDKINGLFGKAFQYKYYGTIKSIINKESVRVHLTIKTYKVLLDKKYDVLATYTDDVVKNGNETFWLSKNELIDETRLREGDKKILQRVFDDRNIDIRIVEDQGERWIDAKTVSFENS
jgi:hypothetical protein